MSGRDLKHSDGEPATATTTTAATTVWQLLEATRVHQQHHHDGFLGGVPSLADDDCRKLLDDIAALKIRPLNEATIAASVVDASKMKEAGGVKSMPTIDPLTSDALPLLSMGDWPLHIPLPPAPLEFNPDDQVGEEGFQAVTAWLSTAEVQMTPLTAQLATVYPRANAFRLASSLGNEDREVLLVDLHDICSTSHSSSIAALFAVHVGNIRSFSDACATSSSRAAGGIILVVGMHQALEGPCTAAASAAALLLYLLVSLHASHCRSTMPMQLLLFYSPLLVGSGTLQCYFSDISAGTSIQWETATYRSILSSVDWQEEEFDPVATTAVVGGGDYASLVDAAADKILSLHVELAADEDSDDDDDQDDDDGDKAPPGGVMGVAVVVRVPTGFPVAALLTAVADRYAVLPVRICIADDASSLAAEDADTSTPLFIVAMDQDTPTSSSSSSPSAVGVCAMDDVEAAVCRHIGSENAAFNLEVVLDLSATRPEFSMKHDAVGLRDAIISAGVVVGNCPNCAVSYDLEGVRVVSFAPAGAAPRLRFPRHTGRLHAAPTDDTTIEQVSSMLLVLANVLTPSTTTSSSSGSDAAATTVSIAGSLHLDLGLVVGQTLHRCARKASDLLQLVHCVSVESSEEENNSGAGDGQDVVMRTLMWRLTPIGRLVARAIGEGLTILEARALLLGRSFAIHNAMLHLLFLHRNRASSSSSSAPTAATNGFASFVAAVTTANLLPPVESSHVEYSEEAAESQFLQLQAEMNNNGDTAETPVVVEEDNEDGVANGGSDLSRRLAVISHPILRLCVVVASYPFVAVGDSATPLGAISPAVARQDIVLSCGTGVRVSHTRTAPPSMTSRGWTPGVPLCIQEAGRRQTLQRKAAGSGTTEATAAAAGSRIAEEDTVIETSEGFQMAGSNEAGGASAADGTSDALEPSSSSLVKGERGLLKGFISSSEMCNLIVEPLNLPSSSSKKSTGAGVGGGAQQKEAGTITSKVGIVFTFPLAITEPLLKFRMSVLTNFVGNLALFIVGNRLSDLGALPASFVSSPILRTLLLPLNDELGDVAPATHEKVTSTTRPAAATTAIGALLDKRFETLAPPSSSSLQTLSSRINPLLATIQRASELGPSSKRQRVGGPGQLDPSAAPVIPTKAEKQLIDNTAQKIAKKNDRSLEAKLMGNKQFAFLEPTHKLHPYYLFSLQREGLPM